MGGIFSMFGPGKPKEKEQLNEHKSYIEKPSGCFGRNEDKYKSMIVEKPRGIRKPVAQTPDLELKTIQDELHRKIYTTNKQIKALQAQIDEEINRGNLTPDQQRHIIRQQKIKLKARQDIAHLQNRLDTIENKLKQYEIAKRDRKIFFDIHELLKETKFLQAELQRPQFQQTLRDAEATMRYEPQFNRLAARANEQDAREEQAILTSIKQRCRQKQKSNALESEVREPSSISQAQKIQETMLA